MLVYHLEFKENSLLFKLEEKGIKRVLYLDTLKAIAKNVDRDALAFLIKTHLRSPNASRSAETLSFQQIEVSAAQSNEALLLIGSTGKLSFKGKPLALETAPAKIYWKGEKHSERACTLSASFSLKGEEIPIESCEKVVSGWFIRNGSIGQFSSQVSWKWIGIFLKGPLLLEGMQKKKFLEEEPPIVWKEVPPERPFEVFPLLLLKDQTGCFADLWMEYPGFGRVAFEDLSPSIAARARLKEAEKQWEKDLLEAGFTRKIVGDSRYYCPSEKARDCLIFLAELGWRIQDYKGRNLLRQTDASYSLKEENGSIAVKGHIHFGNEAGSLRACMEAHQKGRMWVDLGEASVGLLDRKSVSLIEGEWKEETFYLRKQNAGTILETLDSPRTDCEQGLKMMLEGLRGKDVLETALPSPSFKGELLPYQQKGVDWLQFLSRWNFSGLLADEMGLGKTVQVLAFFSRIRTNLPILVVAPTSLLFNWQSEIRKFLPSARILLHSGSDRSKESSDFKNVEWIITSYAVLRIDEEFLSGIEFEAIILDESNAIKTASSQTARAACRLKSRFRLALTGTPMENRPEELWSQFRFLMPDLLGQKSNFQAAQMDTVRRKIRPFILRRRKDDVQIDLPEKIEQIAWVEMDEAQAQIYKAISAKTNKELLQKVREDGVQAHRMEVLEAILRLRQVCSDPRLIGEEASGAKLDRLFADLEEMLEENHKVLIYSQFTSLLNLVANDCSKKAWNFLRLDGSVSQEKRGDLVRQFQEDKKSPLFLLSLKAGGVGLNLTAADSVFLLDPWWNEAVEAQAIDRAHRIGQKKTVLVKRYLTPGTIEEKMLQLKERKQTAAAQLLENEPFNWNEEDLLYLLS